MKVKELMTRQVETCEPGDDLALAAMVMWRKDCGVVPVVDESRRIQGVITDRDICIAAATRHRRPGEIHVHEAMTQVPCTVKPDDDVKVALDAMGSHQIRRVPVVDGNNKLQGVVSINDVILRAPISKGGSDAGITADDIMLTLQAICAHNGNGQIEQGAHVSAARR